MSNITTTTPQHILTLDQSIITEESFQVIPISQYGLKPEDFKDVAATTAQLSNISANTISDYGKNINQKTSNYADELLDFVQSKDLDIAGSQLNQVLSKAQSINVNNLIERPKSHRLPIIGAIIAKIASSKQQIVNNFNSVRADIEGLLEEIEKNQTGLEKRINMLEKIFVDVGEEYRQLGIHIVSGKMVLTSLEQSIATAKENANDPLSVQKVSDLNQVYQNLSKRISDLEILQQSALQTMPMIRIIQSNNAALVQKFNVIKNTTLPAWKHQISLAISLKEQKNSVELANTIDDATNELLRRNADLLHQNSVDTARANQRSVIDVNTIEHVQNTLISTVNDVLQIHKEGQQKRQEDMIKIKELQSSLSKLVLGGQK